MTEYGIIKVPVTRASDWALGPIGTAILGLNNETIEELCEPYGALVPGFIRHSDGTIELQELSLVNLQDFAEHPKDHSGHS